MAEDSSQVSFNAGEKVVVMSKDESGRPTQPFLELNSWNLVFSFTVAKNNIEYENPSIDHKTVEKLEYLHCS